ncbi:NAD-dependent epimerase/dehydratase family protein [Jiangella aurantiaca]|uniref:NAD-dependent epimerase/dehydratase family protein n=1 Tax=Jiangella aurantiaca TaxID=2530373 RepID=A0A4R5AKQ9_9ACTN|nr:NAD-dependent epimerase/dehydratase family protein [Jiangella aurantiaca]TDD70642.1 NAD-dependent epimerase/dehydratase family protein [Jiangella aurantiaca]
MKALVTGGAGFIGGHLSESLLARGHEILAVDNLSTGDLDNVAHLIGSRGYEFVAGSVLDAALMDDLVGRVDTVFHLAAAVGVRHILDRSLDGLRTNVHGAEIVLDCVYRHGARALFASTSEVYGKSPAAPLAEDEDRVVGSPLTTRWSYAEAKALDETLAYLYWRDWAVPTVITRLFNVAGPRQTGRYGMVIPRFVDQALRGEPLTVFGDGQQTRCFCHVRDAVDGIIALVDHPAAYGSVFNIGRPEEISIRQLAERVIALSGSTSEIRHISYDGAYGDGYEDTRRRVPDIARARALTGFDPKLGLDDIILSVIEDRLARATVAGADWSARKGG